MIFSRCCAICADSVVVLLKWHFDERCNEEEEIGVEGGFK
jgi:hypothetical protein